MQTYIEYIYIKAIDYKNKLTTKLDDITTEEELDRALPSEDNAAIVAMG
jgi:hypothetical protein